MQYVSAQLSIQTHLQTLWCAVGISHAVRIERVDTGTQNKNLQYGTVNALCASALLQEWKLTTGCKNPLCRQTKVFFVKVALSLFISFGVKAMAISTTTAFSPWFGHDVAPRALTPLGGYLVLLCSLTWPAALAGTAFSTFFFFPPAF